MTAHKLTPVFPGSVKPLRRGLYQRRYHTGRFYCYFDKTWRFGGVDEKTAMHVRGWEAMSQSLPWRGLAKKA